MMSERRLDTTLWLPVPREEAFEFFGRAGRLLVIDPESKRIRFVPRGHLNFSIRNPSGTQQPGERNVSIASSRHPNVGRIAAAQITRDSLADRCMKREYDLWFAGARKRQPFEQRQMLEQQNETKQKHKLMQRKMQRWRKSSKRPLLSP